MLRFKSYLNERKAQADFGRDSRVDYGGDRADIGGGSGADFGGGFAGRVKSAPLKTPDVAAVAKSLPQQTTPKPPTPIGPESEPSKTPDFGFPKPFSHGQTGPAFKKFDEYMKTGKAPNPNLHVNPQTGGPMEIPDMGGDQPSHLHVHIHNPHTGSLPSEEQPTPPAPASVAAPAPAPQTLQKPQKPTDDTYGDMFHKSMENLRGLGLPIPHMGGGQSHNPNWRDQPGRRVGSASQAAPQVALTPAPAPAPPSQAPTSPPAGAQKWKNAIKDNQDFFKDPEMWLRQRGMPPN